MLKSVWAFPSAYYSTHIVTARKRFLLVNHNNQYPDPVLKFFCYDFSIMIDYTRPSIQVNLDMTDSMGPGKLVRHMQNPSYTYDEYLICIGLGPSISSVICKIRRIYMTNT